MIKGVFQREQSCLNLIEIMLRPDFLRVNYGFRIAALAIVINIIVCRHPKRRSRAREPFWNDIYRRPRVLDK